MYCMRILPRPLIPSQLPPRHKRMLKSTYRRECSGLWVGAVGATPTPTSLGVCACVCACVCTCVCTCMRMCVCVLCVCHFLPITLASQSAHKIELIAQRGFLSKPRSQVFTPPPSPPRLCPARPLCVKPQAESAPALF